MSFSNKLFLFGIKINYCFLIGSFYVHIFSLMPGKSHEYHLSFGIPIPLGSFILTHFSPLRRCTQLKAWTLCTLIPLSLNMKGMYDSLYPQQFECVLWFIYIYILECLFHNYGFWTIFFLTCPDFGLDNVWYIRYLSNIYVQVICTF